MALDVEVAYRAAGRAGEVHCAVQHHGDGGASPSAFELKAEGLEKLVKLAEVVGLEVELQVGERVALADVQDAAGGECALGRLQVEPGDVDHLAAAVVVTEYGARDGDVGESAGTNRAGGSELERWRPPARSLRRRRPGRPTRP